METMDGLVEIVDDAVEVVPEPGHIGEEVVEGLVAVADGHGFLKQYAPGVIADGGREGACVRWPSVTE